MTQAIELNGLRIFLCPEHIRTIDQTTLRDNCSVLMGECSICGKEAYKVLKIDLRLTKWQGLQARLSE